MSNTRALLISGVLAFVAVLMVYSYVSDKEDEVKRAYGEEVVVLVARRDIQPLEDVRPEMLEAAPIPKKFLQPGHITVDEIDALFVTARAVAATSILRGEQVLKTKLLFEGIETGLSSHVPMTKRAVSVPVSEVTAVNRLIRPGNRVDIIAAITVRKDQHQEAVMVNLLQDVLILATGNYIRNEIPRELYVDPVNLTERIEDLRVQRTFTTVTLEVDSLEDAQKLMWVMSTGGTLYFALRNNNDRRIVDPKIIRQDNMGVSL